VMSPGLTARCRARRPITSAEPRVAAEALASGGDISSLWNGAQVLAPRGAWP
jgi:hypothetical protein